MEIEKNADQTNAYLANVPNTITCSKRISNEKLVIGDMAKQPIIWHTNKHQIQYGVYASNAIKSV